MKSMTADQLRRKFRQYINEELGHVLLPSAELISDDPLFICAGVQPLFDNVASGFHPSGAKLSSIQLCVRTNDIEEVGDDRHYTSFEMLGFWSLGAYDTECAIEIVYYFLTRVLGIGKSRLTATVFGGDSAMLPDVVSESVWRRLGVPTTRHAKCDNWWGPVSESGPCGPDTEIFYWTGDAPPEQFDPTCDDRWTELWNIVSMRYFYRDGHYEDLPEPVIDTGGGMERILSIVTGTSSAYDTDLFDVASLDLGAPIRSRIVADHVRTATRLLMNGVVPSRQKHGAVLRRLVRRAVINCGLIDETREILLRLAHESVERDRKEYGSEERESQIIARLDSEVRSSLESLKKAQKWFDVLTRNCEIIDGDLAFRLFSEKGCPLELMIDLANRGNLFIALEAFEIAKEHHRVSSRGGVS